MFRYRRLLRLFGRGAVERELDEELAAHVELRAAELERRGMAPEAARAEALRRLGDRRRLYASARRRQGRLHMAEWLDGVRRDLALAVRRARASPGATALTLATFALGIGLTTAGFTVLDRVLLRPLPFPEPDRLVVVESMLEDGGTFARVSAAAWGAWRRNARSLESSAIHRTADVTVTGGNGAVRVAAEEVTGSFFQVLGVAPLAGRMFTPEDLPSGATPVVVSEAFWRTALGAPRALPVPLVVDGSPRPVVGVVPGERAYPAGTDLWLAADIADDRTGAAFTWINFTLVARLAEGVGVEAAREELSAIARGVREANPEAIYSWGAGVRSLHDHLVGPARHYLLLLGGAVGFVLLVACANVAGLGFARSSARGDELGVRLALGAGRGRLVRQLVTEHLALALAGGALGLLLAGATLRLLVSRAGGLIPRAAEVALDPRIVLVALVATVAAGLAAGVVPALRASAAALRSVVGSGRGTVRGGRRLPGAALVAMEVAAALLLLTGGGLLARSLQALQARDLGFHPAGVLSVHVPLDPAGTYPAPARLAAWDALTGMTASLGGVEAVGLASAVPGGSAGSGFVAFPDRLQDRQVGAGYRVVSPGFFRVLGIPVLRGRVFGPEDGADGERVVVVSRTMAERYWPEGGAVGRQVRAASMELGEGAPWLRVVGVVEDIRQFGYDNEPREEMYVLHRQVPGKLGDLHLLARAGDGVSTAAVAGALRTALARWEPGVAAELTTLQALLDRGVAWRRFPMAVLGGFGLLSLTLAAIGLYGLLSLAVARRTHEMGVRAALGASAPGILGLMLASALRVVLVGVAAGALAAWWLTRLLEGYLVDVGARDPVSFVASAAVLLLVAVAAALVPAWRAARVDPLDALRASG